jgi:hypothetical protein
VFGIVSTGFNIGGMVSPLLFGWLMDAGQAGVGLPGQRRLHGLHGACRRGAGETVGTFRRKAPRAGG